MAYIEWTDEAQKLYDRNKKLISKLEKKYGLHEMEEENNGDGECSWVMRINEVADNIFVIVDVQANIYVFTSELMLLGRSNVRISDPSIIRWSKSKKLLGIGS